ncbi:MAG: hypothetical protein AAFP84_20130, partial [Actinomycetota bacterium]
MLLLTACGSTGSDGTAAPTTGEATTTTQSAPIATDAPTTEPALDTTPPGTTPPDATPTDTTPADTQANQTDADESVEEAADVSTTTVDDAPIVVVDDRGIEVTIESTERIIPADGDLAEIVFALGLGDRVVATDLSATFPAEADAKPEIGYQRALSPEPILQFE